MFYSTSNCMCILECLEVNDGNRGLTSDHIKHGGNELGAHISMFLSVVVSHCSAPNDLLIHTVIPIGLSKK